MNKNHIIIKIVIWSIVVIVTAFIFLAFAFNKLHYNFNSKLSQNLIEVKNQVVNNNISNVEIDWDGNLNIIKTNSNDVKIIQKAKRAIPLEEQAVVTVNGQNLKISERESKMFDLGFFFHPTYLEVYLPEKDYNDIVLKCESGNISSDYFTGKRLDVNLESGNCKLSGNFDKATFEVESGSVKADDLSAKQISAKLESGNTSLKGQFEDINTNVESGTLTVETSVMPKNFVNNTESGVANLYIPENDGFTLDLSKESGNFRTDFVTTKNGSKYTYKNGISQFSSSIESGSFNIYKK